ncbi:MAG TPA: hypothetical protein VFA12_07685 [Stellaceae bacterium]|nr:hypothetical protein [Stellaceae bacterium]
MSPSLASPVIVVHSLPQAVAVLQEAAKVGRAVTLLSAPGAGASAGPGWFGNVVAAARAEVPAARFTALLDCGDENGAALAAIRYGIEGIVFTGRADVAARLADLAARQGASLLTQRPREDLDLASEFFADDERLHRRCAEFLATVTGIC